MKFNFESSRAFVLIQLLAAITLFAVIMLGISSMMSETTRLTRKLKERQESVMSAQSVISRLQRELTQAFDEQNRRGKTLFIARGASEGTELIFSYLDSPIRPLFENRTPGIKVVAYSLERARNSKVKKMLRSEVPLYDSDKIEQAVSAVVARGIVSWEFQFYDKRRDRWVDEWDSLDREFNGDFPAAIKLKLEAIDPKADEAVENKSLVYQIAFNVLNQYRENR